MKNRLVAASDRLARLLPRKLRLGFRIRARQAFGAIEREIGALERVAGRGRVAVDAGANEGWYSLGLAGLFDRVLAFEPNEALLSDLRSARRRGIEIHPVALSNREGVAEHFVPVRGGIALTGWGSLNRDHVPERDSERQSVVQVQTLDSFGIEHLDFLKVDVEGHEVELLEGARETIVRCRPTVLIEVLPQNETAVRTLLEACGLVPVDAEVEKLPLTPGNLLFRRSHGVAAGDGRSG
ncbi:MAG: FkbM family methyltransferase [Thermoanaerobaculia bacterium]|nr:MAG: FkbM family methyltransferase [Thermoanaerobaculia bacterium]MBZ0100784.1 FkbM family methyltransferase [Thermoanaerobaculia bacterium]